MGNERSIDEVLSQFDREQKKARQFNMAATAGAFLAAVGLIALVVWVGVKYSSAEKLSRQQLNEVERTKSVLDTKVGELELVKTERDNKQVELTRLQETVKTGSASKEVIADLQNQVKDNQLKLRNANEQISELKVLVSNTGDPDEAVATLSKQLAEKDTAIHLLKNQIIEKDKTIAEKDRLIVSLSNRNIPGIDLKATKKRIQ